MFTASSCEDLLYIGFNSTLDLMGSCCSSRENNDYADRISNRSLRKPLMKHRNRNSNNVSSFYISNDVFESKSHGKTRDIEMGNPFYNKTDTVIDIEHSGNNTFEYCIVPQKDKTTYGTYQPPITQILPVAENKLSSTQYEDCSDTTTIRSTIPDLVKCNTVNNDIDKIKEALENSTHITNSCELVPSDNIKAHCQQMIVPQLSTKACIVNLPFNLISVNTTHHISECIGIQDKNEDMDFSDWIEMENFVVKREETENKKSK